MKGHTAGELHARLEARAVEIDRWIPRLAWVDVWIRASRDRAVLSVTDR